MRASNRALAAARARRAKAKLEQRARVHIIVAETAQAYAEAKIWADQRTYPMDSVTAMSVFYARHSIWPWDVPQSVGYDIEVLNLACKRGIVFG